MLGCYFDAVREGIQVVRDGVGWVRRVRKAMGREVSDRVAVLEESFGFVTNGVDR